MLEGRKLIDHCHKRLEALKQERSWAMPIWKELSTLFFPVAGRDSQNDRKKTRFNHIRNSRPIMARQTASAGLMSLVVPAGQEWLRLTTLDPDLDESRSVKIWLAGVSRLMLMVFQQSNFYPVSHQVFDEEVVFGQGVALWEPNYQRVVIGHPITNGLFCIAENEFGQIDTFYRVEKMSVDNMARKFGLENLSSDARRAYEKGDGLSMFIDVLHCVEKRDVRDLTKADGKNMPYRSVYMELGAKDKVLREGGYRDFNVTVPRWLAMAGDVYGYSPAMSAMGEAMQLQIQEKYLATAIAYKCNPPLQIPASLKGKAGIMPGERTYFSQQNQHDGIRTAFNVDLKVSELYEDMSDKIQRVREAFFVPLFSAMLDPSATRQMTATEVRARFEDQLRLLAPVSRRMDDDYLKPIVRFTFNQLVRNNLVPPVPNELQGKALNVEFISPLFMAQRSPQINAIDRLIASLGQIYQVKPDVIDNIDTDEAVRVMADATGVSPQIIVSGERVALIRQERQEQQAALQQQAVMANQAEVAAKLSQAQPAF